VVIRWSRDGAWARGTGDIFLTFVCERAVWFFGRDFVGGRDGCKCKEGEWGVGSEIRVRLGL